MRLIEAGSPPVLEPRALEAEAGGQGQWHFDGGGTERWRARISTTSRPGSSTGANSTAASG
jgi:hypothetical protein